MQQDNIDVKFGTPPPSLIVGSESKQKIVLLALQFIVCATLLVFVSPPFLFSTNKVGQNVLEFNRVLALALITTLATLFLEVSGTSPKDSFTKSCEFLYCLANSQ